METKASQALVVEQNLKLRRENFIYRWHFINILNQQTFYQHGQQAVSLDVLKALLSVYSQRKSQLTLFCHNLLSADKNLIFLHFCVEFFLVKNLASGEKLEIELLRDLTWTFPRSTLSGRESTQLLDAS